MVRPKVKLGWFGYFRMIILERSNHPKGANHPIGWWVSFARFVRKKKYSPSVRMISFWPGWCSKTAGIAKADSNIDHPRIILNPGHPGKTKSHHPSVILIVELGAYIGNCEIPAGSHIILHIILLIILASSYSCLGGLKFTFLTGNSHQRFLHQWCWEKWWGAVKHIFLHGLSLRAFLMVVIFHEIPKKCF